MNRRNQTFPFFGFFTAAVSFGIVWVCRYLFYTGFDQLLQLFGKNLSGRGELVQHIMLFTAFLVLFLILILTDRFIFRKIRSSQLGNSLLLLILSVTAVQTLVLCANQILRRDDYWEIADAHSYGFPGSLFFEITHHNGRYLSWGIKSAYAFLPPIPFINILLFLNICLLTTGFSLLAARVLSCQNKEKSDPGELRFRAFIAGTGLSAAVILLSSNVWEVWFWGSGTWVYGLSISLCVLSFALVLRISSGIPNRGPIRILAGVSCFLACGGSELSTASLAAFLFFLLLWKRVRIGKWNRQVLFYLIEVLLCCSGILLLSGSITAAGEFASAADDRTGSLFSSLPDLIKSVISTLRSYTMINVHTLVLFQVFFFLFGTQCRFQRKTSKDFLIISGIMMLTSPLILMLNALIGYMPARVVTIPLCWIISGLALLCFTAGSAAGNWLQIGKMPGILLLCTVIIVFSGTAFYQENIGLVRMIRESWMIRDHSLENVFDRDMPVTTCSIPTLGSSHDDLEADPSELYNIAMRMYYRVPAVTAEKRCSPFDE